MMIRTEGGSAVLAGPLGTVSLCGETGMFPEMTFGALERYRMRGPDAAPSLDDVDPSDATALPFGKEEVERATAADVAEIDRLQDILYAQAKHAVLVVLQGMDTSGKDGTIRKVFGPIDPLGAIATSLKRPTPNELAHDFLWRIHRAVPLSGEIGIFNRSHYEDVLVARVHNLVPRDRIEARYDQINAFERHLAENDVTILKFYLHISKKEQKARLRARTRRPHQAMEVQSRRSRRTRALGRLRHGVPDCARTLQHRMGAVVHRSGGPQMVPQRGRRAYRPKHA